MFHPRLVSKRLCALAVPLLVSVVSTAARAAVAGSDLIAEIRPLLTTFGDPANNIVGPGLGFDGVAKLRLNRSDGVFGCTGTLLNGGQDLLTAAHCLTDNKGVFNTNSVSVLFELPGAGASFSATGFTVHPNWNGDFGVGNDIALISFTAAVPSVIPTRDLFRGHNEVGRVVTRAGFGRSGNGNDGDILVDGTRRVGSNRIDALGDVFASAGFNPIPGSQLASDFDNGLVANDAFDFFEPLFGLVGLEDLGVGADEVLAAPGDSGGPVFLDGQVAGVTSFGARLFSPFRNATSDIDGVLNASFGEFGIDTRVSFFANWIDANRSPLIAPLSGDLNADGFVDIQDLNTVLALWNRTAGAGPVGVADFNADGLIDILDLNAVLANWNTGTPPGIATNIPQPATLGVLSVSGLALLRRRTR